MFFKGTKKAELVKGEGRRVARKVIPGDRKFQIPNSKSTVPESTFILPFLIAFPEGFVFSGCFIAIDPAFIPKEINNSDSDKRYVDPKF
jgi:uncharacterized membrane protein